MNGLALIILFVVLIALMVWSISKWNMPPFLSILSTSLILALVAGIPLNSVVKTIGEGFSSIFANIGIVIILGAIIGAILERSGAAYKLADMVVKAVGSKRPELAISIMGWVVAIPVFCDSGFVILDPIRREIARKTAANSITMSLCLSIGLYTAHVFIPPTPGPIAAADMLGLGNNLLLIIGMGTVVSIPAIFGAYLYARYIGKKLAHVEQTLTNDQVGQSYEELIGSLGKLPSGWLSVAPILVPILLMASGTVSALFRWDGYSYEVLQFFTSPIIALSVGLLFSVALLYRSKMASEFNTITNDTLKNIGPVLLITAAGSALGKVIATSSMIDYIVTHGSALRGVGIFFPFLIAAILKSAQGSSTVAIVTASSIVSPLLVHLGLESATEVALAVLAIGAGAMTVSHANDSYFWIVVKYTGLDIAQGYKTQTLMTLSAGLSSMLAIYLISMFV